MCFFPAVKQLERVWWIVGCLLQQRGQLESTFNHHRLKLSGVGNVSVPALRRKDNCPAGGPCVILLHTWFASSSSTTATALDCTESCLSLLSTVIFSRPLLTSLLHWVLSVLLVIVATQDLALASNSTDDDGIF